MARTARSEVFDPLEIAIAHVIQRCVRRCFLMGNDLDSGKNYDHRKQWLETRLQCSAAYFGIDLLCFSILSNHFHLVLRSRPDVVAAWDDTEVARRWLMICPLRKDQQGNPREPNEAELNMIRNDPQRLSTIRRRLSDISWWMRLLSQPLAAMANREVPEWTGLVRDFGRLFSLAAGLPRTLARQRARRTQRRWHTRRDFRQLFKAQAA